jgi:MFS family permease
MADSPPPRPTKLPRRVWLLGWISLFADVASEMVYPIIPYFVTGILKAPVWALGASEGLSEAVVSFMKGWSGWHSDRSGKRVPYIRWGYGLSALGKPLLGLASAWPLVLVARTTDRIGKGLRTTARDALLADSVDKSRYGAAFGLHRAMDTTGAFLGGVLAIVLLAAVPNDLRRIFLIAAVPGLASVLLTMVLRDVRKTAEVDRTSARARLSELPPAYWRAFGITLLFALANSSDTFLLLRAQGVFTQAIAAHPQEYGGFLDRFGHAAATMTGPLILSTLAYLLYNLMFVGFSYPAGLVSDRIGRWKVIATGYMLYALVYYGFSFATSVSVWALFALYGVYNGLTQGVGKALVAEQASPESRGTALGFFYMCAGGMTLIGNILAGFLWDQFGPSATFLFGSVVALMAVVLIPLTRPWARAR